MNEVKKSAKEQKIIEASEKVFGKLGFKNAKMEDIAKEAKITKVTLYSYFQSKENLYLAVTYKALQLLTNKYYETIDKYKADSGLDATVALMDTFMTFCENNFLYSEALLDYFSMVRATSSGQDQTKLTAATKDSIYYLKLQDIQNLPFKLSAKEIMRGQEDGSILKEVDPMFSTLQGWTTIIGYTKVLSASGSNESPLFNVSLRDLKKMNLGIARALLSSTTVSKVLEAY